MLDPTDAVNHPFFVERRAVRQVPDPLIGEITVPGFPIKFSDAPPELDLVTHALGEDNDLVLAEFLGYDADRIGRLYEDGVLVQRQH